MRDPCGIVPVTLIVEVPVAPLLTLARGEGGGVDGGRD